MIILPVVPVAKPRMTRRDKWLERPAVMKYRAFKDALRLAAHRAGYEIGSSIRVRFVIPMPESWSKRKRRQMDGRPHQARLDLDNLEKALLDCLLPENDASVWHIDACKVWGETGRIEIQNDND